MAPDLGIRPSPAGLSEVNYFGRLAQYHDRNMDQVVGAALAAAGRLTGVSADF